MILTKNLSDTLNKTRGKWTGTQVLCSRLVAVGTSVSEKKYSQAEILKLFNVSNPQIRSIFLNGGIESRHLTLPLPDENGIFKPEAQGVLLEKHKDIGLSMGRDAILRCIENANLELKDIDYLCTVSSTGFITPGFSALLIKDLGLRRDCARLDIVGMGCNAGLNGLNATSGWAIQNPGKNALLVCIEVCSAAYIFDHSIETSVVNSLFGDGAAAVMVVAGTEARSQKKLIPALRKFSSCIIPDAIDSMKYEWNPEHGKFNFFLDAEVPYVIGAYAELALRNLLAGTGILASDIEHWLIHSGGKKVIDSVRINLGLSPYDLRNTLNVLRDLGNVSSSSFLFSYERLVNENIVSEGDYGVMMTMGPGSTIEMLLLQWI